MVSSLETPPLEVITTTTTTCGCNAKTSIWRIVAAFSEGAETTANRARDLGDRDARDAHRLLDLARVNDSASGLLGHELAARSEHPVHDIAMTGLGRYAARGGVRVGEQVVLLEQGKLVAHGRGSAVEARVGRDRLGGHRLSAALVVLHHLAQDQLLSGGEHMSDCRRRPGVQSGAPASDRAVRPRRCE